MAVKIFDKEQYIDSDFFLLRAKNQLNVSNKKQGKKMFVLRSPVALGRHVFTKSTRSEFYFMKGRVDFIE